MAPTILSDLGVVCVCVQFVCAAVFHYWMSVMWVDIVCMEVFTKQRMFCSGWE